MILYYDSDVVPIDLWDPWLHGRINRGRFYDLFLFLLKPCLIHNSPADLR
jgi:hypothetical protein